ncbi:MAG: hypothetical protein R6X14_00845 [bacterium]
MAREVTMELQRSFDAARPVRSGLVGLGLLLFALVGTVRAQELEKVILLPDELSGIGQPTILCYNETEDQIYVSDWRAFGVVVIDAASLDRVNRYETGYGVADLAWSRKYNRVYSADFYDSTVTVYDSRAGQVIATIPGLDQPYRLLLDEPRDKLYVTCDRNLMVIDLAANHIRTILPLPTEPGEMLADTARNRLLVVGWRHGLYFVDSDADTLIKTIMLPELRYQNLAALSATGHRLYVTGEYSDSLVSLCLEGDTVAAIVWLRASKRCMRWHPGRDQLYIGSGSWVKVLDCRADTILATLDDVYYVTDIELDTGPGRDRVLFGGAVSEWGPSSIMFAMDCETHAVEDSVNIGMGARFVRTIYVPGHDMVWTADQDGSAVAAFDAAPLRTRARINVGAKIPGVAWNSIDNRLYAANSGASTVSVIDGHSLTVIDTISVGYNPTDMLWVPELNKLYVTTMLERRIRVVDCATNQVVADLPGRGAYNHFAYSPTSDKVYCSVYSRPEHPDSSVVIVIDGSTNEILTEITTIAGTTRMLWYPDSNWMYVTRNRSIWVIDCESDSVLSVIPGLRSPTAMVYNSTNSSIYVAHVGRDLPNEVLVIDAPTRTIRKRIALSGRPYPLAWNSVRNQVYVGSLDDNRVYFIDCETDSIVATVETPGWYYADIKWNHIEDKLYASDIVTNSVYIIDVPTRRVTGTIPIRSWPLAMAWDPVTNRTYVPTWEGSNVTVIRGGVPAIAGPPGVPTGHQPPGPTIIRNVLNLQPAIWNQQSAIVLLDPTGRKVMDLTPGDNDVRHLAPGVYFVRTALWERSPDPPAVARAGRDFIRKVVIQR